MAGWKEEWIQTARQIVRSEFDRTYAFMDIEVDSGMDITENKVRVHILTYLLTFAYLCCKVSSSENIFDDLPALSAPATVELRDELDQYLSTDPEHVGGKDVFV
jgi:hypothetical protein